MSIGPKLPEPKTLYDHVMFSSLYQCYKHGLSDDPDAFAAREFDRLTPSERLRKISDALEEMSKQEL